LLVGGLKKICFFFFKKKKKKKKKKKRLTTEIVHTIHPHTYTLTHAHKNLDYFFVHLSKKKSALASTLAGGGLVSSMAAAS
jgi:hypothetical protein